MDKFISSSVEHEKYVSVMNITKENHIKNKMRDKVRCYKAPTMYFLSKIL